MLLGDLGLILGRRQEKASDLADMMKEKFFSELDE